jgi:hypothetical protein
MRMMVIRWGVQAEAAKAVPLEVLSVDSTDSEEDDDGPSVIEPDSPPHMAATPGASWPRSPLLALRYPPADSVTRVASLWRPAGGGAPGQRPLEPRPAGIVLPLGRTPRHAAGESRGSPQAASGDQACDVFSVSLRLQLICTLGPRKDRSSEGRLSKLLSF